MLFRSSFLDDPSKFCFLNNGITIVCEEFKALPTGNDIHKTRLTKPSIVNGGQTVATLYDIYVNNKDKYKDQFDSAYILLRIYAVPNKYIINIAKATNTQNPINVVDLHSNDKAQDTVNKYFEKSGVGMIYKIGSDTTFYDDTITNESLLQVYASLYGDEPAKAKVSKRTIFNQYYAKIFNESLDDQMCKKLYRCYEISKFLEKNDTEDKVIIQNAFYTIIYVMKQKDKNVFNENIPSEQIKKHFSESFVGAMIHVNKIIEQKQKELKTKFSLNNLFKSKEIKDLMDLELGI